MLRKNGGAKAPPPYAPHIPPRPEVVPGNTMLGPLKRTPRRAPTGALQQRTTLNY